MDNLDGIITTGRVNKPNENTNEFTKMDFGKVECKCGALMKIHTPRSAYPQKSAYGVTTFPRIRCEQCTNYLKNEYMFHCPKGKTKDHKDGCDVCFNCAAKRKTTTKTKHQSNASSKRTMSTLTRTKSVTSSSENNNDDDSKDNNKNDESIFYNNLYLMAEDRIQIQKTILKKQIDKIRNQTSWKQMIRFEQSRQDKIKQSGEISLRQDNQEYVTFANKLGMSSLVICLLFCC